MNHQGKTTMPATALPHDPLERLAQRRANAKMGWFSHAAVYVAVNLGLALASLLSGRPWMAGPLLGWGLSLALHGLVVWLSGPRDALRQRVLEHERAALNRSR
jgi:hypothetical protein